jgi:ABC-type Fe3+-hydroxamate transport system substrate-binding protein
VKWQSSKSIPIAEYLYPMPVFRDQMHRKVELPSTPQRIISIVPSQTELLYDLGLSEEVIGITKFCIHPEEWFRTKTRVGGTKKLNIELIKSLNPDLIIGNKEENEQNQVDELAKHFPIWMSDVKDLKDAIQMIAEIGNITGKGDKAGKLANQISSLFSDPKSQILNLESRKATYLIWYNPIMVAGGNTFIHSMLNYCHLENVFANFKRYPEISEEELKVAKPDLILLSSEPFPFKEKHMEAFKKICPEAEILLVDGEMFSWYGSRLLKSPAYFTNILSKIAL